MDVNMAHRGMLIAGSALFLLGLLQGATVHSFLNPRMALSAHLTAVQCGMAMMIAGIVWPAVTLSPLIRSVARWAVVGGMYGLWMALTLAAATGASESLPIAGVGYGASGATELLVSTLVIASSAAMTMGWALLLWGLLRQTSR